MCKIVRVRFNPSSTRFRIIPKWLCSMHNYTYHYDEYSFLSCRWIIKKRRKHRS